MKALNTYGIQDDSTLKVDIDQVFFQKSNYLTTTRSSFTDHDNHGGPLAYYVKIRIDNY